MQKENCHFWPLSNMKLLYLFQEAKQFSVKKQIKNNLLLIFQ